MNADIIRFQEEAIKMLLQGDEPALMTLREQHLGASITGIERSDAGFFVNYEVSPDAPRTQNVRFTIGDIIVDVPELRLGLDLVLFVTDGKLDFLEGATFGEPLNSELKSYSFRFLPNGIRDMAALRKRVTHCNS